MPVSGVSHITFMSRDLARTARIWTYGLGATEVYDSGETTFSLSQEKFFLLGSTWIAVMLGEPAPRSYHHVAFEVDDIDLPSIETKLKELGVEFMPPRARVDGEGKSLYFYDFDDNLLELHAGTLQQRLERYKKGKNV
ncbi:FosX/FosE/FosI family fosfomycin resistance thiol transferase [Pseudomonas aeruginosa]|uniref:FosX/FosE/FosI family fosfomycin resistance hydrolase n=1 Tax=Pseudomonas aeruginosa TaxID=287 RepID=UPI000F6AF586|nr:FosX/FosE/FosI family fosfomycin resistance hydrolase [Pseudomonas aeruginosa]AZZ88693.1 FosM [Pseudomonas aeruginosa]RNF58046.1 FosX/FosE/FosI family fosfomycin resistance thiol transferase [Pseudomonas aeruginosa]